MRLPNIRYGDGITKQTQVSFKGYYHSLYAKDGDIYDMRNMSSDQYPLLTPRKNREVYQTGTDWTIFNGSVFEFENNYLYISLTDGVAGSIIKELDMVQLSFDGETDFSVNAGTYIVKSVDTQADTSCRIGFYDTEFNKTGEHSAEGVKLTVIVTGSVVDTEVSEEKVRLTNSISKVTEKDNEYELSDSTFSLTEYSDFVNTEIQECTITNRTQTVLGYGENVYPYNDLWLLTSSENNNHKITLHCYSDDGLNAFMNAVTSDLFILTIRFGNMIRSFGVSGNTEKLNNSTLQLQLVNEVPAGPSTFQCYIGIQNAVLGAESTTESETEVLYDRNNRDSAEYSLSNLSVGAEFITTETDYHDRIYRNECLKTVTKYNYGDSASISVMSIGSGDCLYWVTTDGYFFYDNILRGKLSAGEKTFSETGAFIWIMPDMAYYNKTTGEIVENTAYTQHQRKYGENDYKLYIEPDKLEMKSDLADWLEIDEKYKKDDTVKITVTDTEYRKYEYSVTITGISTSGGYGVISFTEGTVKQFMPEDILRVSVSLSLPDLKFVCAANNRIWGCNDDTIFCSVFGQPFNWFEYSASDSGNVGDIAWSITPFTSGTFTGCVAYRDTPIFFMEDKIIAVNGTRASNFELSIDNAPGVLSGAQKSIVISNDNIYYLSRDGIIRYYSYTPINISEEFHERFTGGCGGATNSKLYISLWNDDDTNVTKLFVYDFNKNVWMVEDDFRSRSFTFFKGKLLGVSQDNEVLIMNPYDSVYEGIESFVEFGDYYCSSPDKKVISKLFIRVAVDDGASVEFLMNYDSKKGEDGKRVWESVKKFSGSGKRSFVLPIIPKRCDHFRIKVKGVGGFVIYSLTHQYYNGTF